MNIPGVNSSTAKLTNVEAQRIMAVLDDAVAKLAMNCVITDTFLDKYGSVPDPELADRMMVTRECRQKIAIGEVDISRYH